MFNFNLGTIPAGGYAGIAIFVIPSTEGEIFDSTQVSSTEIDLNTYNNGSKTTTTVCPNQIHRLLIRSLLIAASLNSKLQP